MKDEQVLPAAVKFFMGFSTEQLEPLFSQIMVAIPLILLYELSIFAIKHGLKR